MFEQMLFSGGIMLRNFVQKDPGAVVGPIASVFGYLLDIFYELSAALLPSEANTLGFAIILLTIAAKIIMLPLGIKSHKSMAVMQKLQPEMDRIRKKYGDSKDPENQRKMNMEVQKLYSENKANPLMGCLPIFIQFPIFMALYYTMNQSYKFVNRLNVLYTELSGIIMNIPNYFDIMRPIIEPKIQRGMEFDMAVESEMVKALGKFLQDDWNTLFTKIPADAAASLQAILNRKSSIENFCGIVLTENTGWFWPSIIIPIICVIATFLSSYLTNKQSKSTDPNMKMQQNITMIAMPIMIGAMTIGMPAGVGLYWAASNIAQILQQVAFSKFFSGHDGGSDIVDPKDPADKKIRKN